MRGVISLRAVTRSFDGTRVLEGVDLEVGDGETVALLGPSGSGKSTILRIISGLERPDGGSVLLRGADAGGVGPEGRDVGYVFQEHAIFPHLDVAANVAFGLRMRGWPARRRGERVAEVLEMVGLGAAGGRDPGSLSGGERQRVALARALAPEPRLLLLDEPFGALDRTLRDRLLLELRDLFGGLGIAVLAVTHDPDEASALADRLAVLVDGRIAQSGPPGEVISRPVDVRVARLVGHTNIVSAQRSGSSLVLPWGSVELREPPGGGGEVQHLLIRPGALRQDPEGPVEGEVTGTVLRGGTPVVRLHVSGLELEAAGWDPVPAPGPVRMRLDPAGCHLMGRPAADAGRAGP